MMNLIASMNRLDVSSFFKRCVVALAACTVVSPCLPAAENQPVAIRFRAQVGDQDFACGKTYEGVGASKSRISPRDFRFYVQSVDLLNERGDFVPVAFTPDGKWQTDHVALLDFEDASARCANGTRETNNQIIGMVAPGRYKGMRFVLGVPFEENHQELTKLPSPLNLTAMSWVWNAGHKFARIELTSSGLPRGYFLHLGSTGCTPNSTKLTIPTKCSAPNRVEVQLRDFNPATDIVVADLAQLLKDSDLNHASEKGAGGCMSSPADSDCAPIFRNFGLPFGTQPAAEQSFFRKGVAGASASATLIP
jgi:uncharacterized repeat protein (TIGR04052 family)